MNIHDLYRPFLRFFRSRRMRDFWQAFELDPRTRVLDVGGEPFNWSLLPEQPQLTFVNLYRLKGEVRNWVMADGRCLPFRDGAFEIVYSNSVIEHLENRDNQQLFADECRRIGLRYYVQTPNRRFPVEPHLITPLIHYLPKPVQRRLLRNFTVWGWVTRPEPQLCEAFLREVRLLDEGEMESLFPDADIWKERVLGLTKSLIAAKYR
jgi:hypothetical protein